MEYSRENLANQLLQFGVPKSKLHRYVNFPLTVDLFQQGVPIAQVYRIVSSRKAARHLILQGLDWKTVKCLTHRKDTKTCAWKGTPHAREVLDLRQHHLTQNKKFSKYAGMDAVTAAQSAAHRLRKRRHSFIKSGKSPTAIPRPDRPCNIFVSGSQLSAEALEPTTNDHRVERPQQDEARLSQSSAEVDEPTTKDHRDKRPEQKVARLSQFSAKIVEPTTKDHTIKRSQQKEARPSQSSAEVVPEKPKKQYEEVERYWDRICDLEDSAHTDDSSSHININATKEAQLESKEPGTHKKRKREESPSLETPAVDLPGETHHHWKRRKLEFGTKRPKVPPSSLRQECRNDGGEIVRPSESPADLGTDVELASSDREAPKEAISIISTLQPSAEAEEKEDCFVSFERTAKISELSAINRSRIRSQGREFKKHEKPIGPSKEFQTFLATRRQRKALLLKDESTWDEEDASFMQSGKKFAEPAAGLGAEFVAKRLLTGRDSNLRKLMKKSQKSPDERRRKDLSRLLAPKKPSRRQKRLRAAMSKSGLHG